MRSAKRTTSKESIPKIHKSGLEIRIVNNTGHVLNTIAPEPERIDGRLTYTLTIIPPKKHPRLRDHSLHPGETVYDWVDV